MGLQKGYNTKVVEKRLDCDNTMNNIRLNRIGEWYNARLEQYLPRYAFFSLIGCFVWNCVVYWVTMVAGANLEHENLTTAFDRAVPFCPAWVSVYVLSYPFWAVSYWLTAKHTEKDFWFRFVTADTLAKLMCGVIFLLFPTTNIRPEILGDGVWDKLMSLIYTLDEPVNLFPSLHCLSSLMSYLGVRKARNLSGTYKGGTLAFAVLVFLSTQFTKQHYVVDIAGGVVVALLCYGLAVRTSLYHRLTRFYEKLDRKIFGARENIDGQKENLDE